VAVKKITNQFTYLPSLEIALKNQGKKNLAPADSIFIDGIVYLMRKALLVVALNKKYWKI
jgi:hypothetical protein